MIVFEKIELESKFFSNYELERSISKIFEHRTLIPNPRSRTFLGSTWTLSRLHVSAALPIAFRSQSKEFIF